jgi:hypothetical protein
VKNVCGIEICFCAKNNTKKALQTWKEKRQFSGLLLPKQNRKTKIDESFLHVGRDVSSILYSMMSLVENKCFLVDSLLMSSLSLDSEKWRKVFLIEASSVDLLLEIINSFHSCYAKTSHQIITVNSTKFDNNSCGLSPLEWTMTRRFFLTIRWSSYKNKLNFLFLSSVTSSSSVNLLSYDNGHVMIEKEMDMIKMIHQSHINYEPICVLFVSFT